MDNLNQTDSIVIYQTTDGETCIDVKFQDETVWLSQAQMAELFQKDRTVIGRHINNIFKEGELEESLYVQNLHIPRIMVVEKGLPSVQKPPFIIWM